MRFDDIAEFIKAGKNPTYRKIENNTYAVLTTDINGNDVFGIQLHKTVIAAKLANGGYQFTDGGWATMTTRDRLNKALSMLGLNAHVTCSRGHQGVVIRDPQAKTEDNPYGLVRTFDFGNGFVIAPWGAQWVENRFVRLEDEDITYIMPNEDVVKLCQKNSQWGGGFAVR